MLECCYLLPYQNLQTPVPVLCLVTWNFIPFNIIIIFKTLVTQYYTQYYVNIIFLFACYIILKHICIPFFEKYRWIFKIRLIYAFK